MKRQIFLLSLVLLLSGVWCIHALAGSDQTADSETGATRTQGKSLERAFLVMDVFHMILGGTAYLGYATDVGIGAALLYGSYTNASYYQDARIAVLKNVHKALMVTGYMSYAVSAILGYIQFGIKVAKGIPVNLHHFITSVITTTFYLFEIVSMALTKYLYDTASVYRQTIATAHGVMSSLFTISFSINILMLPVGRNRKVVLGKHGK